MSEQKLSIRQLLEQRYPPESHIIMAEVSDASGFSRSRSLDWMIGAIWESRGLAVTGIEQKSYRNDWLKELKNPKKQENHFKYCDYFYLFTTDDGVAKIEEIPDAWGWIQRQGNRIKEMKRAPKLEPQTITKSFLMAMLRRAANKNGFVREESIDSLVETRVQSGIQKILNGDAAAKALKELREKLSAFQKESGIDVEHGWYNYYGETGPAEVGKIVKFILEEGTSGAKSRMIYIKNEATRIAADIEKSLKEMNF